MIQISFDVVSAILGFGGGALLAALFFQHRAAPLALRVRDLERQVKTEVERHKTEVQELRQEITVVAYPFEEERGDDGILRDDREAEVGYKFQLFLRGMPCFEPHKIVVKKFSQKQVSTEKIKQAASDVMQLLETWAAQHPAIAVANRFARLGKPA